VVLFSGVLSAAKEEPGSSVWNCRIYPCEHKIVTDPVTGYPLRFITTAGATDRAFYFTHNSFLPDGSMIVFSSDRSGRSEYFGYLTATESWRSFCRQARPMPDWPLCRVTPTLFMWCVSGRWSVAGPHRSRGEK
jgi:hypothetical protein